MLHTIFDLFLHLDTHLQDVIAQYGTFTYAILFAIIFCETGLVVTPFLPGDSLLFAAGTFAAAGSLSLPVLLLLFFFAGSIGDTVNYFVGRSIGPRVFKEMRPLLSQKNLLKTQAFYEKHGGKAILFARFMPIIRTFAPFVAGIGKMNYKHFVFYNVVGAAIWSVLLTGGGYVFGNIPVVREHFSTVILAIIVISILPAVWEGIKSYMKPKS